MSKRVSQAAAQWARDRAVFGAVGALLIPLLACRPGPAPAGDAGCTKDTDCKGDRVCTDGRCVDNPAAQGVSGGAPQPAARRPRNWRRGGPAGGDAPTARGPSSAPKMVWELDLGSVVFARPTVAAGPDGEALAWVGTHAGRFVGVVADGPRAGTIAVELELGGMVWATAIADDNGRLYAGADNDTLYAIDAASGRIAWDKRLGSCTPSRAPGPEGARCDVDGGPTIASDGDLYVGADGVYRLDRDGSIKWHYPADEPRPKHVFSAPVVTDDGLVVFGGQDGFVTALSTDGELKWRYKVRADVDGTAAVGIDGTFYVGADDGRVYALRRDGSLKWSFVAQKDIRSSIAVGGDGSVYVTSFDNNMYSLDPAGNVRWVLPTGGRIAASPTIDAGGTVFVGSQDDRLYAVQPDGKVLYSVEFPTDIDSSVAISEAGTLIVGSDDGFLRGLR